MIVNKRTLYSWGTIWYTYLYSLVFGLPFGTIHKVTNSVGLHHFGFVLAVLFLTFALPHVLFLTCSNFDTYRFLSSTVKEYLTRNDLSGLLQIFTFIFVWVMFIVTLCMNWLYTATGYFVCGAAAIMIVCMHIAQEGNYIYCSTNLLFYTFIQMRCQHINTTHCLL